MLYNKKNNLDKESTKDDRFKDKNKNENKKFLYIMKSTSKPYHRLSP